MGFVMHKRGQGMYARVSAALVLGFTVLYGCWEFYQSDLLQGLPTLFYINKMGFSINVTWGMLVAGVLFAGLLGLILAMTFGFATRWRRLKGLEARSLRFVDFLIEVEGELRKVAWPSRQQLINSTSVVLLATVLFAVFIFGVDQILHRAMRLAGIL